MTPIITAQLVVSSRKVFNPDSMCGEIGVQPHKVWKIGDNIGKTIRLEETNGWLLSTGKLETHDVDEALRQLLGVVGFHSKNIVQAAAKHGVEIELSVSVDLRGEMPSINLSRELISEISRLEATVDIDIN